MVTVWIKFQVFKLLYAVLDPDVSYYGHPKKVFSTFFPCIFYGETKQNSLEILKNKNLFKRHWNPSLNVSHIKYFVLCLMFSLDKYALH